MQHLVRFGCTRVMEMTGSARWMFKKKLSRTESCHLERYPICSYLYESLLQFRYGVPHLDTV
jgi:hypothetical protein